MSGLGLRPRRRSVHLEPINYNEDVINEDDEESVEAKRGRKRKPIQKTSVNDGKKFEISEETPTIQSIVTESSYHSNTSTNSAVNDDVTLPAQLNITENSNQSDLSTKSAVYDDNDPENLLQPMEKKVVRRGRRKSVYDEDDKPPPKRRKSVDGKKFKKKKQTVPVTQAAEITIKTEPIDEENQTQQNMGISAFNIPSGFSNIFGKYTGNLKN